MKMNLTGAIEILKLHKHTTDKFKHSVGDQYVSDAIDTVVAELEKPFPSNDEAGTMAASIASKSKPNLTAQEEAFFVAGFIECVKWMRYLREEETR